MQRGERVFERGMEREREREGVREREARGGPSVAAFVYPADAGKENTP